MTRAYFPIQYRQDARIDRAIILGIARNAGGTVVAHGTPQQVANVHDSATAPFLKKAVAGKK